MGEFFQEDDIIVAETGTSSFGIMQTKLPRGATVVSQVSSSRQLLSRTVQIG